jgi:hypothetical protein
MYVLGGTAQEGEDYLATATRESVDVYTEYTNPMTGLTVYSVTSVYRIDITPTDDTELEGDEDVDIAVPRAASDNGGLIGVAQFTLADNDAGAVPTVWVEAPDSVSTEWQLSTGSFRFVRDDTKLAYPLTVSYEFGESATHSVDYNPTAAGGTLPVSGTVTFAAGQEAVEVKVSPLPDDDATGDEVVELKVLDGAGYAASAIAGTAAVAIKADKLEKRVIITYADGTEVTQQKGMKISKWDNAFYLDANGKVAVREPDANGWDFIDAGDGRPNDRFNVWVYDKAAWDAKDADGDWANPHIMVGISTTNVPGFEAYIDYETAVDLVRFDAGALGKGPGWFWSDSQLLVSNTVDDEYWNAAYLMEDDEGPGTEGPLKNGYRWKVSDRTHKIALGGTVQATYGTLSAKAPVKVEKIVKLNLHNMRDKSKAQGGVLAVPIPADLEGYALKMREIYSQIGIRVEWNIYEQDPPEGLNLSDGLEYSPGHPISAEAKLLLADKPLPNRTTAERSRIEVYFVSNLHRIQDGVPLSPYRGPPGEAYFRDGVWGAKYADSVIIQMGKGTLPPQGVPPYMVLAHECGHILENIRRVSDDNSHYPYVDPLPSPSNPLDTVNLMVRGDRAKAIGAIDNEVTDARRLNVEQQDRMQTTRKNLLSGP